ncbi:MAG: orotidine-5'-phosphate decarboxylase, partial [Firmicutes bacterium]|nr:orotidine-5'-phosphate decarboxylase [Bacillota bacterium]
MSDLAARVERLRGPDYDVVRKASYVALDVASGAEALAVIDELSPVVDGYKVGLELFYRAGLPLIEHLVSRNLRVFLDVKLHDIPNTVAGALRGICQFPIEMVNVHAQGGLRMLSAAREAVDASAFHPLLIGVTLLTSLDASDLAALGIAESPESTVLRLTELTRQGGLDGVVCSAAELSVLRPLVGPAFERIVPGARLSTDALHDQRRSLTPRAAMRLGATRLVLGRAVLGCPDKLAAIDHYWKEM